MPTPTIAPVIDVPEGWQLVRARLAPGQLGETHWPSRTITLTLGLPYAAKRCTLLHECIHVERGPSPAKAYDDREEAVVQRITARRLIDLRALAEALAESCDRLHVADLLEVTPAVLDTRLRCLHPSEVHYLRERLDHHTP